MATKQGLTKTGVRSGVVGLVLVLLVAGQLPAGAFMLGPLHQTKHAPAVAATLKLSPTSGPPTSPVTVKGSGFTHGRLVAVTLDSGSLGSTNTDASGAFSFPFVVPAALVPGIHQVSAADTAGVAAKATFTVETQWPGLGFDSARTGFNPYENVLTAERVPGLTQSGSTASGAVRSSPAVSGNTMFFGSDDGSLHAANGTTGDSMWTFTTGGPILSSPAVYGSPCKSVVFGSDDGNLYSVNCSGGPLWTFRTLGPVRSSPLVVTGISTPRGKRSMALVGSDDGSLYALDVTNGSLLWSASTGGAIEGSPSLLAGVGAGAVVEVVIGSADGTVRAFKAGSGAPLWNTPVGGPVNSSVALVAAGGGTPCRAFVAVGAGSSSTTGSMAALNCETGQTTGAGTWSHALPTSPAGSPSLLPTGNGAPFTSSFLVLAGGADGKLYALNGGSGAQSWAGDLGGGPVSSTPAVAGGLAYATVPPAAAGQPGLLKVMDGSGNLISTLPIGAESPTGPVASVAVLNAGLVVPYGGGVIVFTLLSTWPKFHHDNQNSGFNPMEWQLGSKGKCAVCQKWAFSVGSAVYAPAVANGYVYFGSSNGNVYAVNALNGAFAWVFATGNHVVATPDVVNGVVYVGSLDGGIYALNAFNGTLIWSFGTGDEVWSSAATNNGVVYVGSNDHNLYALAASNGSLVWSAALDGEVGSPALVNGVVYVNAGHNVYALNASDGSSIWTRAVGINGPASSPAVVGPFAYVGGDDGKLYALSASSGIPVWITTSFGNGFIATTPAVAHGRVFFGTSDHRIVAVDTNGNGIWERPTGDVILSSPAVANGLVLDGSWDSKWYLSFEATSNAGGCSYVFSWGWAHSQVCSGDFGTQTTGPIWGSVAVAYGMLFVGSAGQTGTKMVAFGG
jgi:outer membrane protein assembly factor BamB